MSDKSWLALATSVWTDWLSCPLIEVSRWSNWLNWLVNCCAWEMTAWRLVRELGEVLRSWKELNRPLKSLANPPVEPTSFVPSELAVLP